MIFTWRERDWDLHERERERDCDKGVKGVMERQREREGER